jgi:16S rRNA (guanine527-N7)-methyltransferase
MTSEGEDTISHGDERVSGVAEDSVSDGASVVSTGIGVDDELEGSSLLEEILGPALPQMITFHTKLQQEGEIRGLVGPRELPRLWERHILNSAALEPFIVKAASGNATVADIGSGAGFPGIVLAAMLPQLRFTLIEPMERRVEWLDEVVEDLELGNVHIERARAEDLKGKQFFDIVTCRAVAPMTKLSRWVLPLLKNHGTFVALKGRSAQAELDKAAKEIRKAGGVHPEVHEAPVGGNLEETHVVTIVKR